MAVLATLTLVAGMPLAGCGGEEPLSFTDDRAPGARTAPARPAPDGSYDDPIVPAQSEAERVEEAVRDFQESLATGAAASACRELAYALQQSLARERGSCDAAVRAELSAARRGGVRPRPSAILAVDMRGNGLAIVTVRDRRDEPRQVEIRRDGLGSWTVPGLDLADPTGLPSAP